MVIYACLANGTVRRAACAYNFSKKKYGKIGAPCLTYHRSIWRYGTFVLKACVSRYCSTPSWSNHDRVSRHVCCNRRNPSPRWIPTSANNISADTEVLRCYHVLLAAELQQYSKKAFILPAPSQNHGLDGEGVFHLHDAVRLIVIEMKDVGVGVKDRSDTTVATCQDKYYFRGGRGWMMLVIMALTNPPRTSNA